MAKKSKSRKWRWVTGGVGAAVAVGLWGVAFHSRVDIIPAAQSLPDSVGPYRAAGFYWTMADAPHPAYSENENAADLLVQAEQPMTSPQTMVYSQADVPSAQQELESDTDSLKLAEVASHRPFLRYDRDWDRGSFILLKELAPEKAIVKALCLRARCEAYSAASAMRADLATALRLVRLYRQDSTLIAYLVEIACEDITLKAAEFCASVEHGNRTELSALAQTLKDHPFSADMPKALKDEAYLQVATLRNLNTQQVWKALHPVRDDSGAGGSDEPAELPESEIKRSGYPDSLLSRAMLARVLQAWTRVGPAVNTLHDDPEKLAKTIDAQVESTTHNQRMSDMFTNIVFPVLSQAGEAEVRAHAMENCTLALIGALQYQAKNGAYPSSISQIPGHWVDPFDGGKPLRLKRTEDGIRIYSLGPDRVDAGGVTQAESEGKPYNLVAAYPPTGAKSQRL